MTTYSEHQSRMYLPTFQTLADTAIGQLLAALLFLLIGLQAALAAEQPLTAGTVYDHSVTGFRLDGSHDALECTACHVGAVFNELPTRCEACHDGLFAVGKSAAHIQTTASCSVCHNTAGFRVATAALFDHSTIGAVSCVSCHGGIIASGKDPSHILSTDICEACHNTVVWLPVPHVDHNHIPSNDCSSCHRQPAIHVATAQQCDVCHTTVAWRPAVADHAGFFGNCADCHRAGGIAIGKSATHLDTSDNCDSCHQKFPANFAPVAAVAVDHNEVLGICSSCHNGLIAIGKGTAHLPTTEACDVCHTAGSWATGGTGVPDHGDFVANCFACHNGNNASGKSGLHINSSQVCDACHRKFPAAWQPVLAAAVDHNEVIGSCASCHNHAIAPGKLSSHIASTELCEACHQSPPLRWNQVLTVDHGQVIGTCASCHNNAVAAGKPGSHPATTEMCEACHRIPPANFAQWISPPDHLEILGACVTCHRPGGLGQAKSAGHIQSTDVCEACHAIPPAVFTVASVDHDQVLGSCSSCHTKSAGHPPTTDLCEACHHVPPATFAIINMDHSQTSASCVTCHNLPGGHCSTADDCGACHNTNSWANPSANCATTTPAPAPGPAPAPTPVPPGGGMGGMPPPPVP